MEQENASDLFAVVNISDHEHDKQVTSDNDHTLVVICENRLSTPDTAGLDKQTESLFRQRDRDRWRGRVHDSLLYWQLSL